MSKVSFNSSFIATLGVLLGAAIAIGLPALILIYGQNLGVFAQVLLIIFALLGGGPIVFVAAFFGIVTPGSVDDDDETDNLKKLKKLAKMDNVKSVKLTEEGIFVDYDNSVSKDSETVSTDQ